jgi:hypothetical protein
LILTFISANVKRDLGWRQGVVDEEESYEDQLGKNATRNSKIQTRGHVIVIGKSAWRKFFW